MSSSSRCALALLLAAPSWSQEIRKLLESNDPVGPSVVSSITTPIVDEAGNWGVQVGLASPGGEAFLYNRAPVMFAGDRLATPPARILRLLTLAGSGSALTAVVRLDDLQPPLPPSPFAILRNGQPVLIQGLPLDANGLPPGTICRKFEGFGSNEGDTVVAGVSTDIGEALVRFTFGSSGPAISTTADLITGQALPDGSRVGSFRFGDKLHPQPVNGRGDWMCWVLGDDGRERLVTRDRVLLRSGDPSPVTGRTFLAAHPNPVMIQSQAFNDFGDWAAVARLSGDFATDCLLVKNGEKLAQEGELLPALAPELLVDFDPTSVLVSNSGHVLWVANTSGPTSHNLNLMRDLQPILRVGETLVNGKRVHFFDARSVRISPSGRYVMARVYHNLERMLVRMDFGSSTRLESCTPNPGTLSHTDGLVLPGHTVQLSLYAPAPFFSSVRLHASLGEATPGHPCGIRTQFGEFLLDHDRRQPSLFAGFWASVPLTLSIAIPPDPALVDLSCFVQGSFHTSNRAVLTNALELVIGAP